MSNSYYKAMHRIIVAGHSVTHQVSLALKELGISEPQYNVLRILRGAKGKPMSVQEISARMVQKNSNVTRIIDKLVTQKYVIRKECKENRRKMDILITEKGAGDLKKFDVVVESFHTKYVDRLDENEAQKLIELIDKLFGNEHVKND